MLYKPAMEADDITKEVDTMTSDISDEPSKNTDIDTSNTDDIFGTKKKSGITKQNKKKEEVPDTANEPNEEAEVDNSNPDENSDEDVNNIDGDNEIDDSEVDELDNDFELSDSEKMKKLKKRLILLYNVFDSAINTLDTTSNDVNDSELTTAYSKSKEYLSYAKNHIYEIITENLKKDTYPILLKKYIGLCRFYDICVSMIDKSMQKYEESINGKVFTHKKRKSTK